MYFQVHQPHRLRKYQVFDINQNHDYFDAEKNKKICQKVAKKCYIPANKIILREINKHKGKFKVAYSLTGSVLEQFEKYAPEVIESFKKLADTGCVEFLTETYHHSLSYLYSRKEFGEQVSLHSKKIEELFGQKPKVFRSTELIFNNEMSKYIQDMGFKGTLAEGADHVLGWRSPDYVYKSVSADELKILLRNYKLSDDIAFRFSDKQWKEYPLTVEKFAGWLKGVNGQVVNLFMDYETFGEHQWEETGIFDFLEKLPGKLLENNEFLMPSEACDKFDAKGEVDMHEYVSWADSERNLSAWLGNDMQKNAMQELYLLERAVKDTNDAKLIDDWRKLTMSDHFYYMSTKWFSDGEVHNYFNPYDSPYEAFIAFMNILNDIMMRIQNSGVELSEETKKCITENPHLVVNSKKK